MNVDSHLQAGNLLDELNDSPQVAKGVTPSTKLTHIDYSVDADNFQSSNSSLPGSQLMDKILCDIERIEAKAEARSSGEKGTTSSRPLIVALDSLNTILQQTSLQQVMLFLRKLRSHAVIGSVITRLNASAELPEVAQALSAQATAVVLVETRLSLRAYPLLAKERRRDIPQGAHGFVQLVRQKKNGRSSEGIEYFHVQGGSVTFVTVADIDCHLTESDSKSTHQDTGTMATPLRTGKTQIQADSAPKFKAISDTGISSQALLPVRQEDVSFNLSISATEQYAKNQVQLPYMHQGLGGSSGTSNVGVQEGNAGPGGNTLFFIDEDDPDWDDDDLDDDLDI
ncbi:hypothetical protein BBJ29_000839 [Phytophthora kernoviae]|uniref:Elongator complex protein 5 n=1 Tax=Phytophthora kernoviae TaxID=325452 RepID=A0A3F2S2S5_9STRA|nr:hypothetical protein BBJ29_000839 [Phytophthora kernoviae]RLN69114.1 hypothetical protein BBP00_00000555 [Phytophthora kernoviae]